MPDITVEVVGLEIVDQQLGRLVDLVIDVGGAGLKRELDDVLVASQAIVPVASGALHDSGAVSDPIVVGEGVALTIGYGGDNGEVDYALRQHEDLSFRHEEGKEAKFLELPLLEWTKDGPRRVATEIMAEARRL